LNIYYCDNDGIDCLLVIVGALLLLIVWWLLCVFVVILWYCYCYLLSIIVIIVVISDIVIWYWYCVYCDILLLVIVVLKNYCGMIIISNCDVTVTNNYCIDCCIDDRWRYYYWWPMILIIDGDCVRCCYVGRVLIGMMNDEYVRW